MWAGCEWHTLNTCARPCWGGEQGTQITDDWGNGSYLLLHGALSRNILLHRLCIASRDVGLICFADEEAEA